MSINRVLNHSTAVLPIIERLKKEVNIDGRYSIMEFCGGHTHSFVRSGLIDLLPANISLVHGPGCPVCVLPSHPVENSIDLLQKHSDVILYTYGDMMRVPTDDGDSLLHARSRGAQVRSLYSPLEAVDYAALHPEVKVVFLAIGFETTIPPTLVALQRAIDLQIGNFFVYCNHLDTAMALRGILERECYNDIEIDGFIGPGHVSLITGAKFFEPFALKYRKPIVISGFTPYDLALSLLMLVQQINHDEARVDVEYKRAVDGAGNVKAQTLMDRFLTRRDSFTWRGLGDMKHSAFKLKDEYAVYDAEVVFSLVNSKNIKSSKGCLCSQVLSGKSKPTSCSLFAGECTPENPQGVCMVSSEGACSAYYLAGRHLRLGEL